MFARALSDGSPLRWWLSVSVALCAHAAAAFGMASHEAGESARPTQAAQTLFIEIEASGEGTSAAAADGAEPPSGESDDDQSGMLAHRADSRPLLAARPPMPTPISRLIAEAARVDDDVQTAARTEGSDDDAPTEGAHGPEESGAGAVADGRHSQQGDSRGLRSRERRGARGSSPGSPGNSAAGAGRTPAGARLLARSARCNDLFPYRAAADAGRVTLEVDVGPDGTPEHARVLAATPRGEGFAPAAHLCAKRLRFAPARDDMGRAVASLARVRLGFARN